MPGREGTEPGGERQFGPYRLAHQIATGGMAEIHLAKTRGIEGFEKYVALKMIHPNFSSDEHFIQMLIDEAKITVQLAHQNIAQTFDLGRVSDTYYIAMEYVDGSDLFKILRRSSEQDRYMPIETAVYIAHEVASGLDYAHHKRDAAGRSLGIVHRDVSPQNVLISYAGEVKLVDFGIAKATMRAKQTAVGVIKGKYYYMSPEQAWGDKLDHRTDIFSAGILLYEMLTGQMLYLEEDMNKLLDMVRRADIPPPSTKRREVPRELDRLVMRALAKKPDLRFQTAHDFAAELEKFLHGFAPDFTAARLASFVGEVLGPRQAPGPGAAPQARQSIAASRSEFTDENSIIFSLADRLKAPAPAPPREAGKPPARLAVSPNRLTTPSALPPARARPIHNRVTTPSAQLPTVAPPIKQPPPASSSRPPLPPPRLPSASESVRQVGSPPPPASVSPRPAGASTRPTGEPPKPPPRSASAETANVPMSSVAPPTTITELPDGTIDADDLLEPADDEDLEAAKAAERTKETTAETTADVPTTVEGPAVRDLSPEDEPTEIDVAVLASRGRGSRQIAAVPVSPPPVVAPVAAPVAPVAPAPAPAPQVTGPRPTRRTPGSVPVARVPEPGALPLAAPAEESAEHVAAASAAASVWPPRGVGDDSTDDDFFGIKIGGKLGKRQLLFGAVGLAAILGLGALGVALLSTDEHRAFATLEVISIPPGGQLVVDGKDLGTTPVTLERVPLDRPLVLRVELERHEPWQREERISDARNVKVVAALRPILGTLKVDSHPVGAEVFVNNRSIGLTPLERTDLSPFVDGFVEVRKQGFKPSRQPLEWRGGRSVALRFDLAPARE